MIRRRLLFSLVLALPVLVVAFAVLMGGEALARATGDAVGAAVLFYVAMAALMLLAGDVLLLVAALGVIALSERDSRDDS